MRASPVVGRQPLRAFRLAEIQPEIRLRAARAARAMKETQDASPESRILAAVQNLWDGHEEVDTWDGLKAAAENPSDRVYRVSQEAWDRVMGAA